MFLRHSSFSFAHPHSFVVQRLDLRSTTTARTTRSIENTYKPHDLCHCSGDALPMSVHNQLSQAEQVVLLPNRLMSRYTLSCPSHTKIMLVKCLSPCSSYTCTYICPSLSLCVPFFLSYFALASLLLKRQCLFVSII